MIVIGGVGETATTRGQVGAGPGLGLALTKGDGGGKETAGDHPSDPGQSSEEKTGSVSTHLLEMASKLKLPRPRL